MCIAYVSAVCGHVLSCGGEYVVMEHSAFFVGFVLVYIIFPLVHYLISAPPLVLTCGRVVHSQY